MPEDQKSNNFANNTLVVAALISMGGLIATHFAPLQGERQQASVSQLHEAASAQDIDARLWQDPFAVIATAKGYHGVDHAQKPLDQLRKGTHIDPDIVTLWVTMSGAPYFAEEEERRRFRYAVISALASRNFVPFDATHLGFYVPQAFPQARVPFELFEEKQKANDGQAQFKKAPSSRRQILVVWLDEDLLGECPIAKLGQLASATGFPTAIIGPQKSGILHDLIEEESIHEPKEIPDCMSCTAQQFNSIPFYSYAATVAEKKINDPAPSNIFRTIATDNQVANALKQELYLRGIDPCTKPQSIAIISELDTIYGRDLPEAVVRAFYDDCKAGAKETGGQILPPLRKSYLRGIDGEKSDASANRQKGKGAAKSKNAESDVAGKDAEKEEPDDTNDDRPMGPSQRDYLRRLADDLKRTQDRLAEDHAGSQEKGHLIAAIGVLGTDVFDKLLILRALRQKFPEAIFFTTDYDAVLGLKNELQYTRNVIVASSFGSELRPGLQGEIPPFRDAYESSAFLTTQIAITHAMSNEQHLPCISNVVATLIKKAEEKEKGWTSVAAKGEITSAKAGTEDDKSCPDKNWSPGPRLFEVTRAGDFLDLPGHPESKGEKTVHPAAEPLYPASVTWLQFPAFLCLAFALASLSSARPKKWLGVAASLVLILLLGLLIAHAATVPQAASWDLFGLLVIIIGGQSWLRTSSHDARRAFFALFWPAVAFCLALGCVFLTIYWKPQVAEFLTARGDGEPMSLLGGVSLWPPLMLRLFALLLSVWLILLAFVQLEVNFNDICKKFDLIGPIWNPDMIVSAHQQGRTIPAWLNFTYFYRIGPETNGEYDIKADEWKIIALNSWSPHRIARVLIVWGTIAAVLILELQSIFGQPFDPSRGNFREIYERITLLDSFSIWFLVFVVVDATLFLGLFVWRLSHSQTRWPEPTLRKFKSKLGLTEPSTKELTIEQINILDDWIDIQFIAKRTKCINSLVWYPFFVISLMIISRSGLFGNFPLSWPIVITQCVGLLLIFACAFALNWFAEEQRRLAQKNLRDEITRSRTASKDDRATLWENMLDRVTNLNEGSFRNFLQQPVFTGMLLPLASVGGPQLIEQTHLFGL